MCLPALAQLAYLLCLAIALYGLALLALLDVVQQQHMATFSRSASRAQIPPDPRTLAASKSGLAASKSGPAASKSGPAAFMSDPAAAMSPASNKAPAAGYGARVLLFLLEPYLLLAP